MKIVTDNKAYVQYIDLAHLTKINDAIPACVFERVFRRIFVCCDENKFQFVEFTEPTAIEFFKNWRHSIDMLTMQEFTDEEIDRQIYTLIDEYNDIAARFNALSEEEKAANLDAYDECDLVEFQITSLHTFKAFRSGKLKFEVPKEAKKTVKAESPWQKMLKRFKRNKETE